MSEFANMENPTTLDFESWEAKKLKIFEDSRKYEPRLVAVGEGWLISGLDVEVAKMSVGDKKQVELITDRLAKITGQKPAARAAHQSIASFKVREGDVVGLQVTLRGARMYDFIDKLIHIALPRTRDFRGLSPKAIDDMGNMTIGIKENTIFPETSDEDLGSRLRFIFRRTQE